MGKVRNRMLKFPIVYSLGLIVCARAVHSSNQQLYGEDVAAFISKANQAMDYRYQQLEPYLHKIGVRQEPGSPAWYMGASHSPKSTTKNITHVALMAEEATKYMSHALGLTGGDLAELEVTGKPLDRICPDQEIKVGCQPRKYRSMSGLCNNVQTPWWGAAGTAYLRYLPPDYADSISLPRGTAVYPQGLPSAREVSLKVHTQLDKHHSHLVATAAVWAQFVAHDMSLTPMMTGFNGERLRCCGVKFSDFHPECFPIRLPEGDPVHGSARCQEYTRSATAPRKRCTLGPREQLNEATAFLDASNLYGTSVQENEGLREFIGGRLLLPNGLLPPDNSSDCRPSPIHKCFKSGDPRVNENMALAALITVLAREHNRIAGQLAALNPHWVDEILFQEARRILIAQIQIITYREFLPLILGQETMEAYKLVPQGDAYSESYNINTNPSVANSVAVAALHFSVSLMPTSLKLYDIRGEELGEDSIGGTFYAPFRLYTENGVDNVLQSLLWAPALDNNQHVNSAFTDHMFESPSQGGGGLDLVAQLIQRGRDHGVPSYTQWRRFCGFKDAKNFLDLENDISSDTLKVLMTTYKKVTDIDLITGSLSERITDGGTVGPTLRCLLGKQFLATREGDRHWVESVHSGLTKSELRSIKESSTLARLLCDNTQVAAVQPNAFLAMDSFLNSAMNCKDGSIKPLDLSPWREQNREFTVVIPNQLLVEALTQAGSDLVERRHTEYMLYQQDRMADPQSPIGTAFGFSRPKRQASRIANTSLMLEFASSRLIRSFIQEKLKDVERDGVDSLISLLPGIDVPLDMSAREDECLESALPCDHTQKYRTLSGWCNNLENPHFGQSFRKFSRFLPPAYEDGISAPRRLAGSGTPLPSPRLISTRIHTDISAPHTRYTLMVMQFSQITDHDLTFTPVNKGFMGEGILNCKPCDSQTKVHPECIPIPIPRDDPFFPPKGQNGEDLCIPATRSMPGQLTLGPREQMNQLTAYLDLSFMYGSDTCQGKALRTFSSGKLNVTRVPGRKPLLPETALNPECRSPNRVCTNAGDDRSSEQPALGSLHTLWVREHNRVATEFAKLNPHWTDEKIYQETRRVLGGVYQHIAFNEWLVRILGRPAVTRYGLSLGTDGYFTGYDPTCDVTIMNEFSAAAFRFGHSLLRPFFKRSTADYVTKNPPILLRDHFFNPRELSKPGTIDQIILGLVDTPMETLDNFVTNEVTDHLFENKSVPFSGMDLISLNIQRARDHGLHPYNDYREACGLKKAVSFKDLEDTTKPELVAALAHVYQSVDDIDLFPGGMTETPLPGGVIGPTFSCIIASQFSRIRRCDRFWYESDKEFTRFTQLQLNEIRKSTLAAIICNNLDEVRTVQREVLDLPDPFMNPRVPCSAIPQMDLSHWKESASCSVKSVNIDIGRTAHVTPCVSCTCTKEGPTCQSIKVRNCLSLLEKFGAEAVAADSACKVQCLFAFNLAKHLYDTP